MALSSRRLAAQPARRPTSRGAAPPHHPYTGTLDWLYPHPLKTEDTLCLHLPQGAGPDTMTMQRGEVGDSLTLVGLEWAAASGGFRRGPLAGAGG